MKRFTLIALLSVLLITFAATAAVAQSIVLRSVQFALDSAVINKESAAVLDEVANMHRGGDSVHITISGHTCSLGSYEYNQRLSERRAAAVRAYLANHGMSANSITARGYGKSQPKFDNSREEGRRLNRRAEITYETVAVVSDTAPPPLPVAAGQLGIYVAPKFIIGFTQMQGMKTNGVYAPYTEVPFSHKIGNKTDNAFGGALAVGYDFNKKFQVPVRTELEYSIFSEVSGKKSSDNFLDYGPNYSASAKQKLQIQTLFLNAYYDFHNDTAFTPYIGGGLGLAFINSKGSFTYAVQPPAVTDDFKYALSPGSKNSTNFAWNIGAGVAYDINDNISLDLGYRFAGLGKAETKSASGVFDVNVQNADVSLTAKGKTSNVYMHQVMLGLRFTF
jgi:opacity protein-like surface antigen